MLTYVRLFAKVKRAQKGGGVEVYLYSFFTLGARFGWPKPRPAAYPWERDPVPIV